QVLPAVIVEVEERDAGAERLRQVLLAEGAVVVPESDAGRRSDVGKVETRISRCSLRVGLLLIQHVAMRRGHETREPGRSNDQAGRAQPRKHERLHRQWPPPARDVLTALAG